MADQWNGPLEKVKPFKWRIPRSYKEAMRVDGVVYANDSLMKNIRQDQALEQVANVATMPGILGQAMAMPDIHWGYGAPIGGVAAFDLEEGVVSPGVTGYDINCGVRLLRTDLHEEDLRGKITDLIQQIFRDVPSGVGSRGAYRVDRGEFPKVLTQGAQWAIARGYGWSDDAEHLEERGLLQGARPEKVSSRAIERGLSELGTLGSGNHFLEIQTVDEIYDPDTARQLGILEEGQIVLMIHCGSRGFGHQICTDYTGVMRQAMRKYNIHLPDEQLACAPFRSEEAQAYLGAMACAVNYAFANRQCITHSIRRAFERVLGQDAKKLGLEIVYDVAHNIVKLEEHQVGGRSRTVCVHRKGATRAFPPGHPDLPREYQETGQPVLVPGNMGSHSYLLVGTATAMEETFGSTCHGAGRVLSRNQALKQTQGRNLTQELAQQGIILRASNKRTIGEEAPAAYKDVTAVVDTCQAAGISRKVARMRPLGVVKG